MKYDLILSAVIPVIVSQIGEGVREYLNDKREANALCLHGKPGGRFCIPCIDKDESSPKKEKEDEGS